MDGGCRERASTGASGGGPARPGRGRHACGKLPSPAGNARLKAAAGPYPAGKAMRSIGLSVPASSSRACRMQGTRQRRTRPQRAGRGTWAARNLSAPAEGSVPHADLTAGHVR